MARILLLDDEQTILAFLEDALTKYGKEFYDSKWPLRFTKATTAEDALDIMEVHTFELAIVDIMLARMNGWEFIKEVRKHKSQSDLPIVVVSAIDGTELEYYSKRHGASLWFTKPIKPKEFSKQVFNLLAER